MLLGFLSPPLCAEREGNKLLALTGGVQHNRESTRRLFRLRKVKLTVPSSTKTAQRERGFTVPGHSGET